MKSLLTRIRWQLALLVAPLIVAFHRLGKPQGFEAFGAISGTTFQPVPLLSHDDDPNWKVVRMPFTAGGGVTLANVPIGALIKFGAARADVLGALAADDAVLEGVLIDKGGTDNANPNDATVAVALSGSFDKNTIKYADGTQPISAAGLKRLHEVQIYLDAAVTGGAFAP